MRYIATPARMILSGIPHPAEGAVPTEPREDAQCRMPETLAINGVSTLPASVEQGKRQADNLLRRCQARVEVGHPSAVLELLDMNPEFIANAWVRETYLRLAEAGKLRRERGRPSGRYQVNPMIVVGLVGHLIDTRRAKNPEQAFGKLEELGLMTYASAKDSFYRGRREARFKPIFLEFPELDRELTEEESLAWLRRVEVLEPGRTIRRTVEDPQRGTVEMKFTGL